MASIDVPSPSFDRKKAPVFAIGSPRSGTTLLFHSLLSAGNFAVFRSETWVFNALVPRYGDLANPRNRERLVEDWLKSDLHKLSGLEAGDIRAKLMAGCRNGGDFLRIVMENVALKQNAGRWAETTPAHLLYMREIKKTIPNALFLHIIRDGRDVANSLARQGWAQPLPWDRKKPVVVAAMYWNWMLRRGRADGAALGPDYMEVRYEDLVEKPQPTLDRIGAFIAQELDYERIQKNAIGSVKNPNTSFSGSSSSFVGRWRETMQADELAEVECVIGPFLQELGYELSAKTKPKSAARLKTSKALYMPYLDFRFHMKHMPLLGRMFATAEILTPGYVSGLAHSLPWAGADR